MTAANVSTALVAARAVMTVSCGRWRHFPLAGADITVSAVARAARVHRSFIHRHPQLHAAVTAAQRQPALMASDCAVSVASLRTELANMHAQNTRLARHIALLETRLSEALGSQAYEASGFGVVDETSDLRRHIGELDQGTADLTEQVRDREDELNAARAVNRELMAELNRR